MVKSLLLIIGIIIFSIAIVQCQAWNDTGEDFYYII
jgi:hypothetical protein